MIDRRLNETCITLDIFDKDGFTVTARRLPNQEYKFFRWYSNEYVRQNCIAARNIASLVFIQEADIILYEMV